MTDPVSRRTLLAAGASAALGTAAAGVVGVPSARADRGRPFPEPIKVPEAIGRGGAVASVDPYASEVGIRVLRWGGNAVDAAIAMAATLGVTEPFSAGIGGGGFFVYHQAKKRQTWTINGRETAPQSYTEDQFTDGDGNALDFDAVVNSGQSIGVPGTLATWAVAARKFGTRRLADLLLPAELIARKGFVVDQNYHDHTASNAERFAQFPETAKVFLPGGEVPAVGAAMRNPDLADTYRLLRRRGINEFYRGKIGRALIKEARQPTTVAGVEVLPGELTLKDLGRYQAPVQQPTRSKFRYFDVYGMSVPSSGGIAVGAILNLLDAYIEISGRTLADLSELEYLHQFSEASATAFADRNRYVGDIADVPVKELLSKGFAHERSQLFDPVKAQPRPIPFGFPDGDYEDPPGTGDGQAEPYEGRSTTHLNAVDRWGNVVAYTLTIEQTGGSGITVPGHGFLLNNELTDFNFVPVTPGVPDPNLPGPGKRPRSSMSPTIVFEDERPVLTAGTPGGATIITSVAQIIAGHLGRDLALVDAIAAPRLSSRNGTEEADLGLADSATGAALTDLGHKLSSTTWIGNASGISLEPKLMTAAAETVRGGGGAADVVDPRGSGD
ncbi:gamma-glutamyltransferase [Microlunatus speluncae]|uniref:gamma-glutamyltransferase n=1 Tax=Microlunatus speluncae TaxID=2594267 RepID=UPI0012662EBB|nr:gamma-glutamyltransferase [Microlunatus speluncae]